MVAEIMCLRQDDKKVGCTKSPEFIVALFVAIQFQSFTDICDCILTVGGTQHLVFSYFFLNFNLLKYKFTIRL